MFFCRRPSEKSKLIHMENHIKVEASESIHFFLFFKGHVVSKKGSFL